MVRRIFVVPSAQPDSVSIYYNESANTFIVTAMKDDFNELLNLEEANLPGIYVLMGKNKRYVGQSSGSVLSRLENHLRQKPWWNKVVFFGRTDGHLSKDQTDYLERTLIARAKNSNFEVDNGDKGNMSYMNRLNQAFAVSFLETVDNMLSSVLNLNLFEPLGRVTNASEALTIFPNEHNVAIVAETRITGKSKSNLYRKIVAYLVKNDLDELGPIITDDKPNITNFIGKKPNITKKGNHLAYPVNDSDKYYVFTCLGNDSLCEKLDTLKKLVTINFEYQL